MRDRQRSRKQRTQAGFTIIEVLIAVAIMGIGLVAMMGMQIAFVNGSTAARDTTTATAIGETVVERLRAEAVSWETQTNPAINATQHPVLFEAINNAGFRNYAGGHPINHLALARRESHADHVDDDGVFEKASINSKYCVDVTAQYLAGSNNEIIVGQVRVAWPTDGSQPWTVSANGNRCVSAGTDMRNLIYNNGELNNRNPRVRTVYIPFSIRRQYYGHQG